jgi:hypothetical protein
MIPEARLRRAHALYVFRGTPLATIASRYELRLSELEQQALDNGWDSHRLAHLTEVSIATDTRSRAIVMEEDPLKRHSLVADLIVQQSQDLVMALAAVSAGDTDTVKMLRSRSECLKALSETAERAVKLAREARGLVQGQASAQARTDSHGVTYEILMPQAIPISTNS